MRYSIGFVITLHLFKKIALFYKFFFIFVFENNIKKFPIADGAILLNLVSPPFPPLRQLIQHYCCAKTLYELNIVVDELSRRVV